MEKMLRIGDIDIIQTRTGGVKIRNSPNWSLDIPLKDLHYVIAFLKEIICDKEAL